MSRTVVRGVLLAGGLAVLVPSGAGAQSCPPVIADATRLVLVKAETMDEERASLELFVRDKAGRAWRRIGQPREALIGRGGITPYLFAFNRAVHVLVYREAEVQRVGPAPGLYVRRGFRCGPLFPEECLAHQMGLSDRLAYFGVRWGELLAFHAPEVVQFRLRARGFRLAFEQDGVSLWVARPSRLRLHHSLPVPVIARALVEAGVEVEALVPTTRTLEDVFLEVTT